MLSVDGLYMLVKLFQDMSKQQDRYKIKEKRERLSLWDTVELRDKSVHTIIGFDGAWRKITVEGGIEYNMSEVVKVNGRTVFRFMGNGGEYEWI